MPTENLLHRQFNRLTAIGIAGRNKYGQALWLWRCLCGIYHVAVGSQVKGGHTQSCGCLHREKTIARSTKHGATTHTGQSPEYKAWAAMIQRCTKPSNARFADYGGRGITVCESWLKSFQRFYTDMGSRPVGDYSIERKNNNKGYSPDNCKWATRSEQQRNKRNPHASN